VGNSSIIRYTQLFDLDPSVKVFCNRGTSGIDGSTSTALGAAVANEEQTVLISGDIGFFYDSNAFWNKYIPDNFRVIVINNAGGGIFKFIPGPKSSDALDYFETPHNLNAEALCSMFGFRYASARNTATLEAELKEFYKPNGKPSLLEIFTPSDINDLVLKDYFKSLDENL
jgi:2-succinyl-5-enolpyruvyl-6-hydroxy-3-cyclohexene-1-carboxylate synthase